MRRARFACCLIACTFCLPDARGEAPPAPAAPAIPGARVLAALGRVCPMEDPIRIDCNGDGVADSLIPSYQEGAYKSYLSPEMGAQLGIFGATASLKALYGNQNFTRAGAIGGAGPDALWRFEAGGMINASHLSAEDRRLYLAAHDDRLYAIAIDSGREVWRHDMKGNILALLGSPREIIAVSAQNTIAAFKPPDGAILWQKPLKTAIMPSGFGVLLADDRTLYVSSLDDRVVALERASGKTRWDYKTRANASLRLLKEDVLVFAEKKDLVALETATGALRWRVGLAGRVHTGPVLDLGDGIAFHQPFGEPNLMAVDLRNGGVRWSVPFERAARDRDRTIVTPEDTSPFKSALAVQRDAAGRPRVLFAAGRDSLRAVQADDGKVLWSAPVAGTQALLVAGDRVVAADDDRVLHSLSAADGAEKWRHEADAHVAQMERLGDRLLATLYSGDLLVLGFEDGGNLSTLPLGEPYRLVPSAEGRLIVCSESGSWVYAPERSAAPPAAAE